MVIWIPRIVYLVIVIMSTLGIIFAFTVTNINIGDAESHILLHRLHFSSDGISKVDDETGRVYTGIVEPDKLSNINIKSALQISENSMTAKFVTSNLLNERKPVDEQTLPVETFLHEERYKQWQPLAELINNEQVEKGTGSKFPHAEVRYVFTGEPTLLETVVITPNE